MAEAQFIPGAGIGDIAGRLNAGLETSASLMDRTQARQIREQQLQIQQEQHRQEQEKFNILRPALTAKAAADVAEAHDTVEGLQQTEQLREASHVEMPQIREEWNKASMIDDDRERLRAMTAAMRRATKYASVKRLSPEITAMKEQIALAAIDARALDHIDLMADNAKLKAETDKAKTEMTERSRRLSAETRIAVADITAGGKDKLGQWAAKRDAAMRDGNDDIAAMYDDAIKKANHIAQPYSDAERIKTLDDEAKAAEEDGNPALAKAMRDRIGYLTKRGGSKAEAFLQQLRAANGTAAPTTQPGAKSGTPGVAVPPTIKF